MRVQISLCLKLKMFKILKEIFVSLYDILKEVLKETMDILVRFIEFVLPITERVLSMVVKNVLTVFIITSSSSLLLYISAPEIFNWVIGKVGISLDGLDLYKKIELNSKEIQDLTQKIKNLETEKYKLRTDLQESLGEKRGMIEGIKSITIEKVNWWNVILTVAVITIVGGGVTYFIFSGSDGEFFKPLAKLIGDNSNTLVTGITESSKVVNENVVNLIRQMELLDEKIDLMKNAIDILTKGQKPDG
jgi:chaperonin cofactor prefoldin